MNDHKTYLVRKTAAVDSMNYSEKGFPSKWYGFEKFSPQNIWNWETIHAWIISQTSEGWCRLANAAARDTVGTRSALWPRYRWIDLTFLWKFHDNIYIYVIVFLLFSQQVYTLFSWNFHKFPFIVSFCIIIAYKSALRWQKPIYDLYCYTYSMLLPLYLMPNNQLFYYLMWLLYRGERTKWFCQSVSFYS